MQLCVALDLPSLSQNLDLVRALRGLDVWMKVGLRAFVRDGKPFLEEIRAIDPSFKIFLDLKLHDIPNTMADAAEAVTQMGVEMFNVHASAGKEAMQTVMARVNTMPKPPLVLAVTALTSFEEKGFSAVYNASIEAKATQFAKDAFESGLHGVVCSVYESQKIKTFTCKEFLTLTPGIRPFGEEAGDQKRVATVEIAKAEKSDFIVVGRPIYQAADPRSVVKSILERF
ncbi:orotidine-5'-phosphate decarboxylase [Sulfurospirillum sp. T05]|uniref:Orotidine 5'-phosphate decarboxylase n=1 Tax=Sulfurospirillum tamanense TaxID=2813362 RepID=A0ABS2WUB3_9BACT|nr:orotidine-5'-phosphate decarboxylase [Sulfurospirillum tamanensis]MBN2965173.1 orotidine-5'-phosphate decarboxylase [Sulfurospirillum tamanensis]